MTNRDWYINKITHMNNAELGRLIAPAECGSCPARNFCECTKSNASCAEIIAMWLDKDEVVKVNDAWLEQEIDLRKCVKKGTDSYWVRIALEELRDYRKRQDHVEVTKNM